EWIVSDDRYNDVIAYKRMDRAGNETVVVINFAGIEHANYRLGLDCGKYKVVLNSDMRKFGGEEKFTKRVFNTVKKGAHGKDYSIIVSLNKFSGLYLQRIK
ncbi:MAG: alpha amylase C-terminal domain-containing protein, partial [Clostridia bacterium]|nr:alpha amylase C-terminal domain-containing protein [Clostridia bacterium]